MKKQSINLKDLFQEQTKKQNLVTIEQIKDEENNVKITPWELGKGCFCDLSLIINTESINKIYKTEHTHECCGKKLIVVEIELKDDYKVSVSSIFEQQVLKFNKKEVNSNLNEINNSNLNNYQHINYNNDFHNCHPSLRHVVCNGRHICVTHNSRGRCCGEDGRSWCEPAK